jgi:dipeptidyl aminopeptidase/acylaminoacyl peptidase
VNDASNGPNGRSDSRRDLRATETYRGVEEFYRRVLEPAFGRISGADDPVASPDGARLAFTGERLDRLDAKPVHRICVVDVATGATDIVTAGPRDDRSPAWSPDGGRLAFLSDRGTEGRFQIHLLDAGRLGEAAAGPEVPGSIEWLAWSPDGRSLLVGAAGEAAEVADALGSGVVGGGGDEDLPSWMPEVQGRDDDAAWRRAWIVDVNGGAARRASRLGLNVWEAAWCGPDRIAAIVSEAPEEDAWYRAVLAIVDPLDGGERVLYRSDRQLGWVAPSPDGRIVAVVEAICSDRVIVAGDLRLIDAETGAVTDVSTGGVDVTKVVWTAPDRLTYAGVRGTDSVVGTCTVDGGIAATGSDAFVTGESLGRIYPAPSPLPAGGFATLVQAWERFPEVAVVDRGALRAATCLAHEGSAFARAMGGAIRGMTWPAPDGTEIQGFVVTPEGEGPFPLVLVVHGGPVGVTTNAWARPMMRLLASRGFALLMPNPRGSSGRGQAFAAQVYGDMGGADAADLMAGVDAAIAARIADADRLAVMGGSYGGFMAAWLPTTTDRFKAAIALSPVTDWQSQHWTSSLARWDRDILKDDPTRPGGEYFARSPVVFAHRSKTPTLVAGGLRDRAVPPGQAIEYFRALIENGVEAELALYPEEGHGVRKLPAAIDLSTRIVGWLDRFVLGLPAVSG